MALHFILDGYNIIKQVSALADLKLEAARERFKKLIEQEHPQGSLNNKVTIVYDGQVGISSEIFGGSAVKVVFACGETADESIKRMVANAENKKNIVVVTDDREIQYHVRALGAKVIGVWQFLEKIKPSQGKRPFAATDVLKLRDQKEITRSFEYRITEEFKGIWLGEKKKSKE